MRGTDGAGPRPIPRRRLSAERLAAAIIEATTSPAALGRHIQAEDGVGTAVRLPDREDLR